MGGVYYRKAWTRSKCLDQLKACCAEVAFDGSCVNERYLSEETEATCGQCGAGAKWMSRMRWQNAGTWGQGVWVHDTKWVKRELGSESKWITTLRDYKVS
jgi:hypothetical protein